MKIVLKHSYYGIIQEFNSKKDMVDYIKECLEHKLGIFVNKEDTIEELRYKFFGDYKRIK